MWTIGTTSCGIRKADELSRGQDIGKMMCNRWQALPDMQLSALQNELGLLQVSTLLKDAEKSCHAVHLLSGRVRLPDSRLLPLWPMVNKNHRGKSPSRFAPIGSAWDCSPLASSGASAPDRMNKCRFVLCDIGRLCGPGPCVIKTKRHGAL